MKYTDLRDFLGGLERQGELKRVSRPVSTRLDMTAVSDHVLRAGGPALWFERPTDGHKTYTIPCVTNVFGTPRRVALGMGAEDVSALRRIGQTLANLKEPEPPKGLKDAWSKLPIFKKVISMAPKVLKDAPCHDVIEEGDDVDLGKLHARKVQKKDRRAFTRLAKELSLVADRLLERLRVGRRGQRHRLRSGRRRHADGAGDGLVGVARLQHHRGRQR